MKFAPGDVVYNLKINQNGKVIEAYVENEQVMYMVSIPISSSGWSLGAHVGYWSERELEFSPSDVTFDS